jgi:hypothetical protein
LEWLGRVYHGNPTGREVSWWQEGCRRIFTAAQAKFKEKYGVPFTLSADNDKATAQVIRRVKEKKMYGRKVMGI